MAFSINLPVGELEMGIYRLDPQPNGNPVVLLLHGLGADSGSWILQFEPLIQAGMRPIALDVPGFGKSRYYQRRWNFKLVTEQIFRLLDKLGLETFHLVGLSMGGPLALNMVFTHPERVNKLILVNSFACIRSVKADERRYLLRRILLSTFRGVEYQAEMVAQRVFPKPEQQLLRDETVKRILEADRGVYRQAMRTLGMFDARKKLPLVQKETLVVTGMEDTTVPLSIQSELVHGIDGARQVFLPNSGHAAPVDQADLFNRALLDFLKK